MGQTFPLFMYRVRWLRRLQPEPITQELGFSFFFSFYHPLLMGALTLMGMTGVDSASYEEREG